MSTDLHTLSGAFALHALSPEEAEEFQKHLDACAACRVEVYELREAAGQMGASEAMAPPAHLKSRVMAAADKTPQLPPRVSDINQLRRRRWGARFLAAAAAVAVITAGAIGINQAQQDEQSQLATGVIQVFSAEDVKTKTVETTNGGELAVATSPGLNKMAVDTDKLPPLDADHVYQLWAIQDDVISPVLVLEPEKGASMEMPGPDTQVAITIEPAGGSQQPTTEPIIQVTPAEV